MTAPAPTAHADALDGRDLRTGGRWTPVQGAKNAAIRAMVTVALFVADRLPPAMLLALGRALGRAAAFVCRAERDRAEQALRGALATDAARAMAAHCFRTAGENLALSLLLRRDGPASRYLDIDDHDRRLLESVTASGRGAVFVSAHFGPFELVPAAVAELGLRPAVVVRESYDPRLDAVVDAHRTSRGVAVIHRGRAGAAMRIVRALRDGRLVGFLPDLGGRVATLRVPWLHGSLSIALGPQRIALRTGAPVLFGVAVPAGRSSGTPRFRLRLVLLDGSTDEQALTRRVADELAAVVRNDADQWLWMGARTSRIAEFSA